MSAVRKTLPGIALLGCATMAFNAAPCRAAELVVLECNSDATAAQGNAHYLWEINYDAQTVRNRVVDSDGAPLFAYGQPYGEITSPAKISDNVIEWRVSLPGGYGDIFRLGRYTGTMAVQGSRSNGNTYYEVQCHPYAPPHRLKQF
jgi:hypothetical protein